MVKENLLKIIIGIKLNKPILLEGPTGVGKTSLVTVLSQIFNINLYKVNL